MHLGSLSLTMYVGVTGHLVGPLVFKTKEGLHPQSLVGSIPIRSRPCLARHAAMRAGFCAVAADERVARRELIEGARNTRPAEIPAPAALTGALPRRMPTRFADG